MYTCMIFFHFSLMAYFLHILINNIGMYYVNKSIYFQEEEEVEKHLDMPPSWVEPIQLSLRGELLLQQ